MSIESCAAMILAGGRGERLGELTSSIPKPLVSFGGKYRLIDFTLSNCIHAGIRNVGVVSQYLREPLHDYISCFGARQPNKNCAIRALPPKGDLYSGTADAIYKNLGYLDGLHPKYVFILSGDHVYNMDYEKMLRFHIERNADVTVAATNVPWDEVSRFGIMATGADKKVIHFEEKPRRAFSTLASMGVYLFNWDALKDCLVRDHFDQMSSHDFGRDVLPEMIFGCDVYAYIFDGYWRDVGTVDCLWQSNMDMLSKKGKDSVFKEGRCVYSGEEWDGRPVIRVGSTLDNTIVVGYSFISGCISNSILGLCTIGAGSRVSDSIIMPGACIGDNVTLRRAIVLEGAYIYNGVNINTDAPCDEGMPCQYTDSGVAIVGDSLRCVFPKKEQRQLHEQYV